MLEHSEEDPLGPFEIGRFGGIDFAVPIDGEAMALQLCSKTVFVLLRDLARMNSGFNSILFSGQAEGIPTHRLHDVISPGFLVSGQDVRGGITLTVPDVQTLA